jgi:hypothetical protein
MSAQRSLMDGKRTSGPFARNVENGPRRTTTEGRAFLPQYALVNLLQLGAHRWTRKTRAGRATGPTAKIFISYSRHDLAFVDRLEPALVARGFAALIDRQQIYAFEDWWQRLQSLITQADTVVFTLSPDSAASEICQREIAYAASLNKRFAPIVCLAPATYGTRNNKEGQPNPKYARNKSEFLPLIAGDSTPSIVVFFKDDDTDPGGRGAFTQSTFDKRAVPYILIDGPAGLVGHGASWLPLFDFAFGDCFATFLAAPATTTCRPPPLDDSDFRTVLAK